MKELMIFVFALCLLTVLSSWIKTYEIKQQENELVSACQYECKSGKILLHPNPPNGCFIPLVNLSSCK